MEQIDELYEEEYITFYTVNGIYTVPTDCSHIHFYHDYEELCSDWLNTGISKTSKDYRCFNDKKQREIDRNEYYDFNKQLWFVYVD